MKKIIAVSLLFIILIGFLLVLRGDEDTWICSGGHWIRHGNPTASMSTSKCMEKPGI